MKTICLSILVIFVLLASGCVRSCVNYADLEEDSWYDETEDMYVDNDCNKTDHKFVYIFSCSIRPCGFADTRQSFRIMRCSRYEVIDFGAWSENSCIILDGGVKE